MTTIKITGTLNFNSEGILLKSELMGFTMLQQYKEEGYPDSYVAYKEDIQFYDATLDCLIASIIEHLYEKAI